MTSSYTLLFVVEGFFLSLFLENTTYNTSCKYSFKKAIYRKDLLSVESAPVSGENKTKILSICVMLIFTRRA